MPDGDAEVQVGHLPVDEVEDVRERPAVQLGFDPLGVRVRGELLARVVGDQEQGVILRVGDLELVGAEGADLLGGGVRVHLQGLGGAARAQLLQGNAKEVLQDDNRTRPGLELVLVRPNDTCSSSTGGRRPPRAWSSDPVSKSSEASFMHGSVQTGTTPTHCLDVQGGLSSGEVPGSRPQTAPSAAWSAGGATGAGCSGPRSSEPGPPAPPGSS